MTQVIAARHGFKPRTGNAPEPAPWKQGVSAVFRELKLISDGYTGKIVVTFKDGGVSYLEKTETLK